MNIGSPSFSEGNGIAKGMNDLEYVQKLGIQA
jgi:hypothetical protein